MACLFWLTIIDKSLRWKQYRMQIGGLKFVTRPNTHAKFKTKSLQTILSSFPNVCRALFLYNANRSRRLTLTSQVIKINLIIL